MIQLKNLQPNINDAKYKGLDASICKNVESGDVDGTPGFRHVYLVTFADGATNSKTITLPAKAGKCEIVDVTVIKTAGAGGASDTVQVLNAGVAVTDAIDMNVADKVVKRAATIDDASNVISDAGVITITNTKASAANTACRVYIEVVRTP